MQSIRHLWDNFLILLVYLKHQLYIFAYSIASFILPAKGFFFLVIFSISLEWLLHRVKKSEEEVLSGEMALLKMGAGTLFIWMGLICDSAFKLNTKNLDILVKLGLANELSPIAYVFGLMFFIWEAKQLDALVERKWGTSIVGQFTKIIPTIFNIFGYSLNKNGTKRKPKQTTKGNS